MTSWPKPFVPPTEVDDEAKNEFKKLFIGNIDIAQLSLLDPCRYSVGKVWDGFDRLISLATEVNVRFAGETEPRLAKVLASDPGNDLALLKIEATDLKPATFAQPGTTRSTP